MDNPVLRLAADIGLAQEVPGGKSLFCARDVEAALHGFSFGRAVTWGDVLVSVEGIAVHVAPHYAPGQWKLVLHDHCDQIAGGGRWDEAVIISHAMCTVMDSEPLECQGS